MNSVNEEKIASKWLKEAQKGYIRIALLILVSKRPYHGYEMMKEVEDRTEGFWRPTAGGITGKWNDKKRKRKNYRITEAGKLILDRALLKHSQIAESMNSLFAEYTRDVLDLEPNAITVPQMPNPFSVFLKEQSKTKVEALETKGNQLRHMIKMLQTELQKVEDRLTKLNRQKQKHNKIKKLEK
jgi:DNA-binding PadR family transcriptional regulator